MKILELNSLITEIKSSLDRFNRRFKIAKEIISEPVYKEIQIIESEEWKKNEQSQTPGTISNIHIHEVRVPRRVDKER